MKEKFPWKRFWCPTEGKLQLDDDGYLLEPEGEYGYLLNPDVVPFEKIKDIPCLVLLGEPGIGKSNSVEDEINNIKQVISPDEDLTVIDLKEYGSEDRLCRDLFGSDLWKNFKTGRRRLHLFLDSLDEVRFRIPQIAALILSGLKEAPLDRLLFRIVCRTAEWPWSFSEGLKKLWGEARVSALELSPLTVKNVRDATIILGVESDQFMKAVADKKVGSLASKPVTLNFLLNLYKKESGFPSSQYDLYEKGCLSLCTEPNLERREIMKVDERYGGNLTPRQRLHIASRIAAALIFGNKYAVYTDSDFSNKQDDGVTMLELSGGSEKANGSHFIIDEKSIQLSLGTGLFSSRGPHLMGFAHQTYAEFLASRYLRNAPIEQSLSLFLHPYDNRIIPQLYETAAWLAGQRKDFFSRVLSIEPETLLRSDVTKVDEVTKERLVSELIDRFKKEEIIDDRSFREHYYRLSHPTLEGQLKPIISDKRLSVILRRFALDLAEACGTKDLQQDIADVALDPEEDYHIRTQAAHAVWKIADAYVKKRLEPLAKGQAGDDPNDDLRACGLRCMWPDNWNILELLKNITPPKKESYFGGYWLFLTSEAIPYFAKGNFGQEMPAALSIIKTWPHEIISRKFSALSKIYDELIRLAWILIPNTEVLEKLGQIYYVRFEKYLPLCDKKLWTELASDSHRRYSLIKFMIDNVVLNVKECSLLVFGPTPLVTDSDFSWLLEQIEGAPILKQPFWAELIMKTLRENQPTNLISRFLELRRKLPILQQLYDTFWYLESDISKKAKATYLEQLRWKEMNKPIIPEPPVSQRMESSLQKIEEGIIDEWYELTLHLSANPETGQLDNFPSSIIETPGWKTADQSNRDRIKKAAISFLTSYMPKSDEWFGKGSYSWKLNSIFLAIRLIAEDEESIKSISSSNWRKLVPNMIDCPAFNDHETSCLFFNLASSKDPEETKKYLIKFIESENERHGRVFFLDHLKNCWNPAFTSIVIDQVKSNNIKPRSFGDLIKFLCEKRAPEIDKIVVEKFTLCKKTAETDMLVETAILLVSYWVAKYWELVWNFFNENQEIADHILQVLAERESRILEFINNLSETHLAELYLFMTKRFPPEEDPHIEGAHRVIPREMVADLRMSILMHLVNCGTQEACFAIKSLAEKLPKQRFWIMWRLREAEANMRRKTWNPPSVQQIISLLQESIRRCVQNEEQLIGVVLESLKRMQDYYKGELAPVERVWNYEGAGSNRRNFKPKDEESLSDEVARWLREDLAPSSGIIVNREVQPQRGQKTDVYINAIDVSALGEKPALKLVIEVKGCWHPEVFRAMETQLVFSYMKDNHLRSGLYLVGWYWCDKWTDDSKKQTKGCQMPLQVLKEYLSKQSKELMTKLIDINVRSFVIDLSL